MRVIKWLAAIFIAFLALAITALALLPMILSSNWGREQLASSLSMSLDKSVKIESLELGWFSPQSAKQISISSSNLDGKIGAIVINESLWKFVFNGFIFNEIQVNTPHIKAYELTEQSSPKGSSSSAVPLIIARYIKVADGSFALIERDKSAFEVQDISLEANINRSKQEALFKLVCSTSFNGEEGKVDINGAVKKDLYPLVFNIEANITDLQMSGLDKLAAYAGLYDQPILLESIGPKMDAHLELNSQTNQALALIKSKHLNLNLDSTKSSSALVFNWAVNPSLLKLFGFDLKRPFFISSNAKQLKVPSIENWRELAINMKTVVSNLEIDNLLIDHSAIELQSTNLSEKLVVKSSSNFSYPYLSGELRIGGDILTPLTDPRFSLVLGSKKMLFEEPLSKVQRTISEFECTIADGPTRDITATLALADVSGPSLLGNDFKLKLTSKYDISQGKEVLDPFSLDIDSSDLKGSFAGSLDFRSKQLKLSRDGYIDYQLTPEVFDLATSYFAFPIDLKGNTSVSLMIEKSSSIDQVEANLFSEDFTVTLLKEESFDFQNIDAHIEYSSKENQLKAGAQLRIKKEGSLEVDALLDIDSEELIASIKGKSLPSDIISPWFELHAPFSSIIGKSFNIEASLERGEEGEELRGKISAPYLEGQGGFAFDKEGQLTHITEPFRLNFSLTPPTYAILSALSDNGDEPLFKLSKPAHLAFNLSKFKADPSQGFASSQWKGMFALEHFAIEGEGADAEIDKLILDLKKKRSENATATLSSTITSDGTSSQIEGSIEVVKVDLNLPWHKMIATMHTESHLDVSKLPTLMIEGLLQPIAPFPLAAVLGQRLNADVDLDLEPNVKRLLFDINSTDSQLYINGMAVNNKFLLKRPIEASLRLTRELTDFMFSDLGFAFETSNLPITLDISDKGFLLPIEAHPLNRVQIQHMILDLGKINALNQGNLGSINKLFKVKGKDTMPIWFAPFYMSMNRGKLFIDRTEILVDGKYHICVWGSIDFQRKYVDLVIGLTASSLKKTLGISGLPESYVLQVPLEGPFGHVDLKEGAVAAKIALLIGGKSAPKNLFGGVLDIFNQVVNDQSDVPPPRRPYPWEMHTSMKEKHRPILELKRSEVKDEELIKAPLPFDVFLPVNRED